MRHLISITTLLLLSATTVLAEDRSGTREAADKPAVPETVAGKRLWLKDQVVKGLTKREQVRQAQQFIDKLTPDQINTAVNGVLAQQLPPNAAVQQQLTQQAQLELLRAQALRQYLEYLVALQHRRVGYAPVITWLPQGTQFGASAVVSPDRRHVRINANPYFSSIGPVYNYDLNTGQTWLQQPYPYSAYPQPRQVHPHQTSPNFQGNSGYNGGIPYWHLPPQQPRPDEQRRVWYDGMRTRVSPR